MKLETGHNVIQKKQTVKVLLPLQLCYQSNFSNVSAAGENLLSPDHCL